MEVCSCNAVDFEMIKAAVKKHGDNLDAIQEETDAGTTCECCLEDDCDKVDLPLHAAIKKALEAL
jgi:NAD(P)H-nitrite reductase large subunit